MTYLLPVSVLYQVACPEILRRTGVTAAETRAGTATRREAAITRIFVILDDGEVECYRVSSRALRASGMIRVKTVGRRGRGRWKLWKWTGAKYGVVDMVY